MPASAGQSAPPEGGRKILYYRNPMGLPDTSPVPKKDPMGMDYIAVYAGEEGDPNSVKVSLDKIQRSGVRTEKVASLPITRTVRGVGTVEHDETSLRIVTVRSDGYIEDLFVNKTGRDDGIRVEAGVLAGPRAGLAYALIVCFDDLSVMHRLRAHEAFRTLGVELMEYVF